MRRRTFLYALSASSLAGANSSLGMIAYIQWRDLWVRALPNGQPKRLTTGTNIESPRFSPTGKGIAGHRGGASEVCGRDGGYSKPLPGEAAEWLPDRDVLIVSTEE